MRDIEADLDVMDDIDDIDDINEHSRSICEHRLIAFAEFYNRFACSTISPSDIRIAFYTS